MTLLALIYFSEQKLDVALLETGIGGRLDSTNVIIPEVAVITTISLEHTDMLGNTYTQIASEKAGIIKEGKPVVVGVKNDEALTFIKQTAREKKAPIYTLNEQFFAQSHDDQFDYHAEVKIDNIELAMYGEHQMANASLAIKAAQLFLHKLNVDNTKAALKKAKWQGRFERICDNIIVDGAHNSEGTIALIETLQQALPNKKYVFIYAALQDKDHGTSIARMDQVAHEMNFTQIALPRAATAQQLFVQSKHPQKFTNDNWLQLVEQKIEHLQKDEILIITGSLYFIAEVRRYFVEKGWI